MRVTGASTLRPIGWLSVTLAAAAFAAEARAAQVETRPTEWLADAGESPPWLEWALAMSTGATQGPARAAGEPARGEGEGEGLLVQLAGEPGIDLAGRDVLVAVESRSGAGAAALLGGFASARTDAHGRARFRGVPEGRTLALLVNPPGRRALVPDPRVHGFAFESFASAPFPFVPLDAPSASRGGAAVIRVIAGTDAAGRVLDAGGARPIGGATVWVAAPGMVQVTSTGDDGSFEWVDPREPPREPFDPAAPSASFLEPLRAGVPFGGPTWRPCGGVAAPPFGRAWSIELAGAGDVDPRARAERAIEGAAGDPAPLGAGPARDGASGREDRLDREGEVDREDRLEREGEIDREGQPARDHAREGVLDREGELAREDARIERELERLLDASVAAPLGAVAEASDAERRELASRWLERRARARAGAGAPAGAAEIAAWARLDRARAAELLAGLLAEARESPSGSAERDRTPALDLARLTLALGPRGEELSRAIERRDAPRFAALLAETGDPLFELALVAVALEPRGDANDPAAREAWSRALARAAQPRIRAVLAALPQNARGTVGAAPDEQAGAEGSAEPLVDPAHARRREVLQAYVDRAAADLPSLASALAERDEALMRPRRAAPRAPLDGDVEALVASLRARPASHLGRDLAAWLEGDAAPSAAAVERAVAAYLALANDPTRSSAARAGGIDLALALRASPRIAAGPELARRVLVGTRDPDPWREVDRSAPLMAALGLPASSELACAVVERFVRRLESGVAVREPWAGAAVALARLDPAAFLALVERAEAALAGGASLEPALRARGESFVGAAAALWLARAERVRDVRDPELSWVERLL